MKATPRYLHGVRVQSVTRKTHRLPCCPSSALLRGELSPSPGSSRPSSGSSR